MGRLAYTLHTGVMHFKDSVGSQIHDTLYLVASDSCHCAVLTCMASLACNLPVGYNALCRSGQGSLMRSGQDVLLAAKGDRSSKEVATMSFNPFLAQTTISAIHVGV